RRRRVLDMTVEPFREPEQTAKPLQRDFLELRGGGRGAPQHRVDVQRSAEKLREYPRLGAGDREVAEEARMVPVRDAGQEDAVEVVEDVRERLPTLGRLVGKRRLDVARLDPCEHGQLADPLEIAGGPLEGRRPVAPQVP